MEKAPEPITIIPEEPEPLPEVLPDFANITDVDEKKETFFDFMEPFVDAVNEQIFRERQRVLAIVELLNSNVEPLERDMRFLSTLAEKYELDTEDLLAPEFLNILLRRQRKLRSSTPAIVADGG